MSVSRETNIRGWGWYLQLQGRAHRWWWTLWCPLLAFESALVARTYDAMYPTAAARIALQRTSSTDAGLNLLYGRPLGLTQAGGFVTWRVGSFLIVLAAVVGTLTAVRNTRAEEDSGREELLRAGAVGRDARLVANLVEVSIAGLIVIIGTALSLVACGLGWEGSVLTGAMIAMSLLFWAAAAAAVAQILDNARAARMFTLVLVAVGFVLRGLADAAHPGSWCTHLTWLSPVGWAQQTRPFVGGRMAPLGLLIVASILLSGGALLLHRRRDIMDGLVPQRPGPTHAAAFLSTPASLVLRNNRASAVVWLLSMLGGGALLGGIAPGIVDMVAGSSQTAEILQRMGGSSAIGGAYFSAVLPLLALLTAVQGLSLTAQLASDDSSGAADAVLVAGISRRRFLGSYLAVIVVLPSVVFLLSSLAMGLGSGVGASPQGLPLVWEVLLGALCLLPGLWVIVGAGVLAWVATRRMWLSWSVVGVVTFVAWIGAALHLPRALLAISPFDHLPHLPGGRFTVTGVVVELILGTSFLVASLVWFERHDIGG